MAGILLQASSSGLATIGRNLDVASSQVASGHIHQDSKSKVARNQLQLVLYVFESYGSSQLIQKKSKKRVLPGIGYVQTRPRKVRIPKEIKKDGRTPIICMDFSAESLVTCMAAYIRMIQIPSWKRRKELATRV